MKILFTGGGTGGHILPIIAVARELRRKQGNLNLEFFYMGPKDDFSDIVLSQEGIKVMHIFAGKVRRYEFLKSLPKNLLDVLVKMPLGTLQAFARIFVMGPDLVFSKGGYGSVPSAIASWILRVPIVLHESDVVPGMANKITGAFAKEIFVSFPNTQGFKKEKMIEVGNPVREQILTGSKEEAKRLFDLKGGKPVILIMGGSQGASRINDALLVVLDQALQTYEILHQTGEKNYEQVKAEAGVMAQPERIPFYHASPFFKEPEMRHAYAAADLIVSRAGSGSIFEIAALGKPSILIPLPEAAQNHQVENAYAYQKSGACMVLEESNLSPHFFLERINSIFAGNEAARMSEAAFKFSKPRATSILAEYIVEYLSPSSPDS